MVVAARFRPVVKREVKKDSTTLVFDEAALRKMEIDKNVVFRSWGMEALALSQSVERGS